MTASISDLPRARRADLVALMRESYGEAISEAELEWLFDGNPAGHVRGIAPRRVTFPMICGKQFAEVTAQMRVFLA